MGCLTCPAAERLRQMVPPGPPEGGGSAVRARASSSAQELADRRRGREPRRCRGGLDRLFQVLRSRRVSGARPAACIRRSHGLTRHLVRLGSPRPVARSRARRGRGRTARRSVRARQPSRRGNVCDRVVEVAEALEAPSPELEAARTIGEHLEGTRRRRRDRGARPRPGSRFGGADRRARCGATGPSHRARSRSRTVDRASSIVTPRPGSRAPMRGPCRRARCPARARWRRRCLCGLRELREVVQLTCPSDQVGRATLVGLRNHSFAFGSPLGSVPAIVVGIVLARAFGTGSGRSSAPTTVYPIWDASLVAGTSGPLGARSS